MKVKGLILGFMFLTTGLANASCFNIYQQNLAQVKEEIKGSKLSRAQKEALAMATTTNVIVYSALTGGAGGPLVSTALGAGFVASLFMAKKYVELRAGDSVEEAIAKQSLLESSLGLLKEAKIGNGPILQQAIVGINRSVSTSISLKDLADKINEQSERNLYCSEQDQVMSTAGILQSAIDELK